MKSAPLVAGSALCLVLVALATANPFSPLRKVVPLDFTGIDTLEFRGMASKIEISSGQAAQASYSDEVDKTLEVLRKGNRLVIIAHSEGYLDVELSIPTSVRAIDVESANIVAKERLQSMQVSSSSSITWSGDITRLDLRDTAKHSKNTDDHCGCSPTSFTVSDGRIAELLVRSPHGILRLSEPDKIDAVYAWLGENGSVSLDHARRFDNVHLLPTEVQISDAGRTTTSARP